MSYTTGIKNELAVVLPEVRCCLLSEIAGLINTAGCISEQNALLFKTENWAVARKYFTLLSKAFKIDVEKNYVKKTKYNKSSVYELIISDNNNVEKVLYATGVTENNEFTRNISGIVVRKICCKRSCIRGVFLAGGSVTTPEKGYHLEISLKTHKNATDFISLLKGFDINAKALNRQFSVSVYIKDSTQIADFLNVTGAKNALFEFENTKVLKEVRNGVNRQVNCDAANIKRTVVAAQKQLKAIELIDRTIGVSSLPENLAKTAVARLNNPDMKLVELAEMLNIGKSGISHRLRKIEEIAESIK